MSKPSTMSTDYLVDLSGQDREPEAVRRLIQLPFLSAPMLGALGVPNPEFAWYVLDLQKRRVVGSKERGEIDILVGSLEWLVRDDFERAVAREAANRPDVHPTWHFRFAAMELAVKGGLKWPPSCSHLVGIEAKCCYLPAGAPAISSDHIKAKKTGRGSQTKHIRDQVRSLEKMGFDRVALLDMIATPPCGGRDIQAWLVAGSVAAESLDAIRAELGQRLPPSSTAAHWAWPIGAVAGADERSRGSGCPVQLRPGHPNVRSAAETTSLDLRQQLEANLRDLLAGFPQPRYFPAIIEDCKKCASVHRLGDCPLRRNE